MEKIAKVRSGAALVLAAAALLLAVIPVAAHASGEPTACETVSLSFVQKTLKLSNSTLLRDHTNTEGTEDLEPSELPRAVHSECGIGLWSGQKPTSRAQLAAKARAGHAAQVGVDTWAPNSESPSVGEWESREFDELTARFLKDRFQIVHVTGKAKALNPEGDGYSGAGFLIKATGFAHGLEVAAGCWWSEPSKRAICIFTEEAVGKPVVDHLNALGKKIVPNFLGAP